MLPELYRPRECPDKVVVSLKTLIVIKKSNIVSIRTRTRLNNKIK